jgi:uncharacterized protein (TIGR02145 family)
MKSHLIIFYCFAFLIFVASGCKKDESIPVPVLSTNSISNITQTTATCGGIITSDGGLAVSARGVCWSTALNPTIANSKTIDGNGVGSFISNIPDLIPNTIYYVRAYATNSAGTGYGPPMSFTTEIEQLPVLTTTSISDLQAFSASCGGTITSDGGGAITARGVCWSTSQNPVITNDHTSDGTGHGIFTSSITGLTKGTTYFIRAYATNIAGTAYGQELSFITDFLYGTVTDIEGNVYKTIDIGTQIWMAENLNTSKYNDNSDIPLVQDGIKWAALSTPGYCWYPDDTATYKKTYGSLYNWYALSTGKLCPTGWHVPSDAEWTILIDYLGGEIAAGGKLKEAGFIHWRSPNTSANNETGFTALPGGCRYSDGNFGGVGFGGLWWSSTEDNANLAWLRYMYWDFSNFYRLNYDKRYGFSVRCIKDN